MPTINGLVPVLLFLTGHQPLAFVVGQCCHLLNPMASLFGYNACREWAVLLSEPTGLIALENFIAQNLAVQE